MPSRKRSPDPTGDPACWQSLSQLLGWTWHHDSGQQLTIAKLAIDTGYLDNIFIERLWRTLKYECTYRHAWETGSQARAGVRQWMEFYNHRRPHNALGGQPPAVIYSLQIEATQPDQQEQIRA